MPIFKMQQGTGGGGEPRDVAGGRLEKASATSLEWQPYFHNCIGLYNGSNWVVVTPSSTPSLANSANDLDSAALAINYNYDIYAEYASLTALNLVAKKWTNDTTRAVTPARWDGVLCYDNSTTNGKKRRFLGTIRMLSSSGAKFEDSSSYRFISNYYNRVEKSLIAYNSTSSWLYGDSAWREFNNGSGQTRGYMVNCVPQDSMMSMFATVTNLGGSTCYLSPGVNGSNLFSLPIPYSGLGSPMCSFSCSAAYSFSIGLSYISQYEYGSVYGKGSSSLSQTSGNRLNSLIQA